MSGRKRQWVPLPSEWPHNSLGERLLEEFGPNALAVFPAFVTACKRNYPQGEFQYVSDAEAWGQLGFGPEQPFGFTLEEFFKVTGRMKETRLRRHGRTTIVEWTRFAEFNNEPRTGSGRKQIPRSDVSSTAPEPRQNRAYDSDIDIDIERDTDSKAQGEHFTSEELWVEALELVREEKRSGKEVRSETGLAHWVLENKEDEVRARLREKRLRAAQVAAFEQEPPSAGVSGPMLQAVPRESTPEPEQVPKCAEHDWAEFGELKACRVCTTTKRSEAS